MGMVKEFKEFAMKGNVVDMAVGIIIGTAFGKIVASMVNDLIMPVIGMLTGGVDFSQLHVNLNGNEYENLEAAQTSGDAIIAYGQLLQNVFDFVIVAFVVFMMIRAMNNLRRKEEEQPAAAPEPAEEIVLLREIRDGLSRRT